MSLLSWGAPLFAGSPILVDHAAQFRDRGLNFFLGEMLPNVSERDTPEFWNGRKFSAFWIVDEGFSEDEWHMAIKRGRGWLSPAVGVPRGCA
jgi:hypothetical protein